MTPQELNQASKAGKIQDVTPPADVQRTVSQTPEHDFTLADFLPLLLTLSRPKVALTSAPTFIPKTLLDSIQLYDDGVNRRLYLFILSQSDKTHSTGTWRYVALT